MESGYNMLIKILCSICGDNDFQIFVAGLMKKLTSIQIVERNFCNSKIDALVKSIQMAKLKVSYTRRSDFSDKKSYM